MPYKIFQQLFKHPLTDLGIESFNQGLGEGHGATKSECTTIAKDFLANFGCYRSCSED